MPDHPRATGGHRPAAEAPSRSLAAILAVIAGTLPDTANAQYVPTWMVAAVLSPILVLLLCAVLGWLERSLRTGMIHAGLVLLWVVLFWLASYYVQNDYVIWTPLALYVLHTLLLLVLIVVEATRRIAARTR